MRQDSTAFAAQNKAPAKEPRLVVRIVFDVATIYVTSAADMTNVPGTDLLGHLQNVSAVSQEINPDEARSTIGSMSFDLVDIDSEFTDALREQLQTELQNLRGRTVELRLGYTSDYNDTQVLFTQQVRGCVYDDGTYRVTCNDIQRETRKDILEPLVTNLRLSVDDDDTTIPVQDTTGFETVFHGPSYTDGPSTTVGYIRIDDEIIRYTGTTADSFTGCTRGVFNTVPAAHEVQSGAANDRQPEVEEFIYLELPGPKLAYALLTGVLSGDSATLPDHWHMGVSTSDVTLSQFQNIGVDLWDTTDDDATLVLRFAGLDKTDGKRFLEEQVYQPLGVYSPVLNDGSLGLRRMNHILADAPYVMVLDEDSFTQVGALEHDYDALLNVFSIDWNWDPIAERFTRRRKVIDQGSIDVHGEADTKLLEWEGIHGSRHTDAALLQRSDSIRDRYTGPPLRLSGSLLHSYNVLEVGDVVRVQLAHVRDYTGASGPIDRSFEIQRIGVNQISGEVSVSLFGSSQRAAVLPPGTGTAIPDGWYDDLGTELSTVVTIVAGVIQPGTYNLTGNANLKNTAAVYYYLGDLELADGATLTINDNVQIRVRGFFTINGDIDGAARGNAGATDDSVFANDNAGVSGFIGSTRGWEGLDRDDEVTISGLDLQLFYRGDAVLTSGLHSSFPLLELSVQSGALVGLPDDIRGTSGGIGGRVEDVSTSTIFADGGDGGDGGAGLAVICRGASLGASASINVSGGDSATGAQVDMSGPDQVFQAGSGAPGAPGGVLFVIDGSGPSRPDVLGGLTAAYGSIPDAGEQPNTTDGFMGHLGWLTTGTVADPLAGFNTSIGDDISASVLRIQRLAPEQTPEEDVTVPAPANLAVVTSSTGFEHVLTNTPPPAGVITEYFGSITDDRGDAVLLGASTAGRFVTTPDPSTLTYYWARNRQIQTYFVSLFAPNTTTSTVQGAALDPPTDGEDGAQGPPGPQGDPGEDAILGLLSNEAHTVAAASDGTGYSLSGAGGTFKVWEGATDVTGSGPTYSVVAPATKNGLTIAINSTSGVYSLSGASWTSDLETFTLRAVYGGVTVDRIYTIAKSKAGATGAQGDPGNAGADAILLSISATAQSFKYNGAGTLIEPSSIVFTAIRENSTNTVSWKTQRWNGSSWVDTTTNRVSPTTGLSTTLTEANFATQGDPSLRVLATMTDGVTFTDAITVVEVQDGADGAQGDPGSTGDDGLSVFLATVYQRAATAPATPTADDGSYNFGTRTLTPPSGWSISPPAGPNPLYSSEGTFSVQGTTGTDETVTWSAPVQRDNGGLTLDILDDFVVQDTGISGTQEGSVQIESGGNITKREATSGSFTTVQGWIGNGANTDYQVKGSMISGAQPTAGVALNTWHDTSTTRLFQWQLTADPGTLDAEIEFSFRNKTTGSPLGSVRAVIELENF